MEIHIVAEKVTIQEKAQPKSADPNRPIINAAWLFLFMAVVTIWFAIHVKTYVTQLAMLGTVTLWSGVQLAIAAFGKTLGDDAGALRKRLMGRKETTWNLWFLCFVAAMLFVATSSVYVKSSNPVELKFTERTGQFIEPIHAGDEEKTAGRPVFSRFHCHRVDIEVVKPDGYHAMRGVLVRPGEPLTIEFPGKFEKRSLVRIYVPYELSMKVPPADGDLHKATRLEITADGKTIRENEFTFRSAYVGVTNRALAARLVNEAWPAFQSERHKDLDGREDAKEITSVLADWQRDPLIRTDWDLKKTHTVTAKLIVGNETRLVCSAALDESKINDCVLAEAK